MLVTPDLEKIGKKHLPTWGLCFFVHLSMALSRLKNDKKLVGNKQLGDRTRDSVLSMSILQDEMWKSRYEEALSVLMVVHSDIFHKHSKICCGTGKLQHHCSKKESDKE